MQIEQAVHDELLATSAVTTLVGTNIHYLRAPQDTKGRSFPYIVILKVSAPRTYSFDGLESVLPTRMQLGHFLFLFSWLCGGGGALGLGGLVLFCLLGWCCVPLLSPLGEPRILLFRFMPRWEILRQLWVAEVE